MNTIKLYTNRCLTCDENDRVKKVKDFATKHNLQFAMRRTDMMASTKAEAEQIGAKMPFVEYNGKTTDFFALNVNPTIEDQALAELLQ